MDPVQITIEKVVATADPETITRRTGLVERLDRLGHIRADDGTVNTQATVGWTATINGATVPLIAYAVEPAEGNGVALVSLVVPADQVSVGRPHTSAPAPAVTGPEKLGVWGQAAADPRENIPGWTPEGLGQQVADNARASFAEQSLRSSMVSLRGPVQK